MVAMPPADDQALIDLAPLDMVLPGQLDRHFDRLGASRGELEVVQITRRDPGYPLRQVLGRLIGEDVRDAEGKLSGLASHRIGHALAPMPYIHAGDTCYRVNVLFAGIVPDVDALTAH